MLNYLIGTIVGLVTLVSIFFLLKYYIEMSLILNNRSLTKYIKRYIASELNKIKFYSIEEYDFYFKLIFNTIKFCEQYKHLEYRIIYNKSLQYFKSNCLDSLTEDRLIIFESIMLHIITLIKKSR